MKQPKQPTLEEQKRANFVEETERLMVTGSPYTPSQAAIIEKTAEYLQQVTVCICGEDLPSGKVLCDRCDAILSSAKSP